METLVYYQHYIISPATLLLLVIIGYSVLLYNGFNNRWVWTLLQLLVAEVFLLFHNLSGAVFFSLLAFVTFCFAVTPLASALLWPLFKLARKLKPLGNISERERIALLSGNTWVEKDLFSGAPKLRELLAYKNKPLTQAEKAFLAGPVERVCAMTNDFRIHEERELPAALWNYLKTQKFFGMLIPTRYGGLGFSAEAQSLVIQKLASRSYPLAVTVMVPNSLGPAELLLKYGSKRQKDKYLRKLATGKFLPCFALTEPLAGSDASSITSEGILFKNKQTGELQIKLTWRKRYITLAAISDVLGLAFQLKDPQKLLEADESSGITCALIPTTTKGVILGKRHDPLNVPFYNCPTEGNNIIVGLDAVIGERQGLGKGWSMLMECLAAGRGISLPALSAGGLKLNLEVAATYSYVRRQFGLPLYQFEGVSEKLAPICAMNTIIEAARRYTTASIDAGFAAPIVSAILKYHATEMVRRATNHTLDILGGAGISRGRRNLVANPYMAIPIAITVEGANILTRSFIIFGQGLFRAHPHLYQEMTAIEENNLGAFTRSLRGHLYHITRMKGRGLLFFLTRGYVALSTWRDPLGTYKRKLLWSSTTLALLSESVLLLKGSALKRSEMLTGQLGDILSWLYLLTATLARSEQNGVPAKNSAEGVLLQYAMTYGFAEIQTNIETIIANLLPGVGPIFSKLLSLNPIGGKPRDSLLRQVAANMVTNAALRRHHTEGLYIPPQATEQLQRLQRAFNAAREADGLLLTLRKSLQTRGMKFDRNNLKATLALAGKEKILSPAELKKLQAAQKLMQDAIEVDAFTLAQYKQRKG